MAKYRIEERRGKPRRFSFCKEETFIMFIYPDNLTAKATLWLWTLRDIGIIGVFLLISILALSQIGWFAPMVLTCLYAFLAIRVEHSSILDYLRAAVNFLFIEQQHYEWRLDS